MKREHPSTPQEAFEASTEGAYYGREMAAAAEQGRICDLPINPSVPDPHVLGHRPERHHGHLVHAGAAPPGPGLRGLLRGQRPQRAPLRQRAAEAGLPVRPALLAARRRERRLVGQQEPTPGRRGAWHQARGDRPAHQRCHRRHRHGAQHAAPLPIRSDAVRPAAEAGRAVAESGSAAALPEGMERKDRDLLGPPPSQLGIERCRRHPPMRTGHVQQALAGAWVRRAKPRQDNWRTA